MTTATATDTTTKTYAIDLAHSEVLFQVRHLLAKVRGRFSDFSGTIAFDAARPERSKVAVTIRATSIDTNQADRDTHLRSGDFFAVEQYPTLTFTSTAIDSRGGNEYSVTGDLTIRGVTKTVVLPVTYLGVAKDPWGNEKLAFETEVTINRKDYGLNWNAALETGGFLVGEEVKISVSIEAGAGQYLSGVGPAAWGFGFGDSGLGIRASRGVTGPMRPGLLPAVMSSISIAFRRKLFDAAQRTLA